MEKTELKGCEVRKVEPSEDGSMVWLTIDEGEHIFRSFAFADDLKAADIVTRSECVVTLQPYIKNEAYKVRVVGIVAKAGAVVPAKVA